MLRALKKKREPRGRKLASNIWQLAVIWVNTWLWSLVWIPNTAFSHSSYSESAPGLLHFAGPRRSQTPMLPSAPLQSLSDAALCQTPTAPPLRVQDPPSATLIHSSALQHLAQLTRSAVRLQVKVRAMVHMFITGAYSVSQCGPDRMHLTKRSGFVISACCPHLVREEWAKCRTEFHCA